MRLSRTCTAALQAQHLQLGRWMAAYFVAGTPGLGSGDNGSIRLDLYNDAPARVFLFDPPEDGGRGPDQRGRLRRGCSRAGRRSRRQQVSYVLGKKLQLYLATASAITSSARPRREGLPPGSTRGPRGAGWETAALRAAEVKAEWEAAARAAAAAKAEQEAAAPPPPRRRPNRKRPRGLPPPRRRPNRKRPRHSAALAEVERLRAKSRSSAGPGRATAETAIPPILTDPSAQSPPPCSADRARTSPRSRVSPGLSTTRSITTPKPFFWASSPTALPVYDWPGTRPSMRKRPSVVGLDRRQDAAGRIVHGSPASRWSSAWPRAAAGPAASTSRPAIVPQGYEPDRVGLGLVAPRQQEADELAAVVAEDEPTSAASG